MTAVRKRSACVVRSLATMIPPHDVRTLDSKRALNRDTPVSIQDVSMLAVNPWTSTTGGPAPRST
jgi:hypothetical protein